MSQAEKNSLTSKASSINRALDQIGDKWCLLILQEVFWGINTFNQMHQATGASRGVLTDRLDWLQSIDCLQKHHGDNGRPIYHLTRKSMELYQTALMAISWERKYFTNPNLDSVELVHRVCGKAFSPQMQCRSCDQAVALNDVQFRPGSGAGQDQRPIKTRRRSPAASRSGESVKDLYINLVNLLGDRWTANIIALAFHGLTRFDDFIRELPVATNILSDRLKLLVDAGVLCKQSYQQSPLRYEYHLTDKGRDLFPFFTALLSWGDKWCETGRGAPMLLSHTPCGSDLIGDVVCDQCGGRLFGRDVKFS